MWFAKGRLLLTESVLAEYIDSQYSATVLTRSRLRARAGLEMVDISCDKDLATTTADLPVDGCTYDGYEFETSTVHAGRTHDAKGRQWLASRHRLRCHAL